MTQIPTQLPIIRQKRQAQFFRENLGNGIELHMVLIPAGDFLMGAPESEEGSDYSERPQHPVTVPTFFMGKYPVTQAQWREVAMMSPVNLKLDPDPSEFKESDRPVEQVSWDEAVEFCDRLSRHTTRVYRLPSEAEWEYACRAGTTTPFHFGQTISTDVANYNGHHAYGIGFRGVDRQGTTAVGNLGAANHFGLYDMHGNVWEWCADRWHDNYIDAPTDGSSWTTNETLARTVLRGGSWLDRPKDCRSASRRLRVPNSFRGISAGLRVACSALKTQ